MTTLRIPLVILTVAVWLNGCSRAEAPIARSDSPTVVQPDSTISGAIINIGQGGVIPDTLLSFVHHRSSDGHALDLELTLHGAPRGERRVLATRSIPTPKGEEYVALATCELDGKPDLTIAALVAPGPDGTQERVLQAWRADLTRRTLDSLSTQGIDCIDEEVDP